MSLFLTYVHDTSDDMSTLESIRVVREFMDVLPIDILGAFHDKDNDFDIDLKRSINIFYLFLLDDFNRV